jgi:hypothetical protein
MEAFMQNEYKGKELLELNKCRLYLRCTTLADIANGKGDKLLMAAIHCHRSPMANPTSPESITAITMEKSTAQMLHT